MIIPPKFALLECANMDYLIRDIEDERFLNRKEEVELLNELHQENIKLKEEIKAYPINEQYAEEIIKQNQKLRIERNDLRRENEQLKEQVQILKKEKIDFFRLCDSYLSDE